MIALFLTLLLTAPLEQEPASYKLDEVIISTYEPRHVDVHSLYELTSNLLERSIQVEDRYVTNLNLIYDRILIYDTKDATARILAMLAQIDQGFEGTEAAHEMEQEQRAPRLTDFPVQEYRVRSLSLDAAFELLSPFYRDVEVMDVTGNYFSFVNLSRVVDNVLLIRDTAENTASMLSLLEKFDRPAPQVQISVWVLRGGADPASSPVPADLTKSLQLLIPELSFHMDARGMLRSSIGPDLDLRLSLKGLSGEDFALSLSTGPFDGESGSLALSECMLLRTDVDGEVEQLFQTTTSVRAGEYAVIGLTGAEPVLLALRLQVLQ